MASKADRRTGMMNRKVRPGKAIAFLLLIILAAAAGRAAADVSGQDHTLNDEMGEIRQLNSPGRLVQPIPFITPSASEKILIPILRFEPTPTPDIPPTPTDSPQPAWLVYVNQFRTSAGLNQLDENSLWSSGDWLHSRYMVKNDYVGHSEDPGNPWYTSEGLAAAENGNVFVSSWIGTLDETPIDFWMTAPFHAISMLDPQLYSTGYGIYREAIGLWKSGATLDVRRGLGAVPPGTSYPIMFPADGGITWLPAYYGGEFPDPLTSCPGFSPPTGPPIMLQLGSGELTPQVTGHTLTENGNVVQSCLYDETSYDNPDPNMQSVGRIVLGNRDAVVIMPRYPFTVGSTYSVSVFTQAGTITWDFEVTSPSEFSLIPPSHRVEMWIGAVP